ncbi:MAG: alpha-ribazole transporter [Arachnia sp.]
MTAETSSPRRLARVGILIALSVVGAMVKLPSPTGTVAVDAAPAFLAAFAFTMPEAMLVAVLGHLVSAATAGFPLSLPVHAIVAPAMAVAVAGAFVVRKKFGLWAGAVVGIVLNGLAAPLALVPLLGWGIVIGLLVPLLVGSAVNVVLAVIVAKALAAAGLAEQPAT